MPSHFPLDAVLRDGRAVRIRPFTHADAGTLWEFFQRLPPEVRRVAWDNIDDRALVDGWGRNIDYTKVMPMLAMDGSRIIADATLHQRKGGPLRLVGRIKWLVDPLWRGQGLGTILVQNLIRMARDRGLRHVTAMPMAELESDAISTLVGLGFERHIIPGYGTDPEGNQHDMVKLVLKL